jgi:hypothetical protein
MEHSEQNAKIQPTSLDLCFINLIVGIHYVLYTSTQIVLAQNQYRT